MQRTVSAVHFTYKSQCPYHFVTLCCQLCVTNSFPSIPSSINTIQSDSPRQAPTPVTQFPVQHSLHIASPSPRLTSTTYPTNSNIPTNLAARHAINRRVHLQTQHLTNPRTVSFANRRLPPTPVVALPHCPARRTAPQKSASSKPHNQHQAL